jgi:archaellum biogenesis protein FlaJ (TadC family)
MASTALITIVPPFVVDEIEGGKSYPMFFFFAIYLLIACIINANILPHDFS